MQSLLKARDGSGIQKLMDCANSRSITQRPKKLMRRIVLLKDVMLSLTQLMVHSQHWWSFALEAFGEPDLIRSHLRTVADHFFASYPSVDVFTTANSCASLLGWGVCNAITSIFRKSLAVSDKITMETYWLMRSSCAIGHRSTSAEQRLG
jgi:hypothetical protein